jgi:hypothetical protein
MSNPSDLAGIRPDLYDGFEGDRTQVIIALQGLGLDPEAEWKFAFEEIEKTDEYFGRSFELQVRATIRCLLAWL